MFSSHILEVVIGLIFIVLLFSLLATSLQEILANFWNSRGRMLREAIYSMTGTAKPPKYRAPQKIVWTLVALISIGGLFYGILGQASVLKQIVWVHSLVFLPLSIVLLARPYAVTTYHKQIDQRVASKPKAKSLHTQMEKGAIEAYSTSSQKDRTEKLLLAEQILQHPRFTRLGRRQSIDDYTGYIPSEVFAEIFTESLGETYFDHSKSPVVVAGELRDAHSLDPATTHIIEQFLKKSKGNKTLFQAEVANWFDDTMEQVQGWYKREAQRWLFFMGILLGVGFNINLIEVAQYLNESDEARRVVLSASNSLVQPSSNQDEEFIDLASSIGSLETAYKTRMAQADSLGEVLDVRLSNLLDSGEGVIDSTAKRQVLDSAKSVLINILRQDSSRNALFTQGEEVRDQLKAVQNYAPLLGIGWNKQALEKWDSLTPMFIIKYWIAILMFALAVSLGAPFWFDLLKRFVNIRSAGVRPQSSKEKASTIEG